MELAWPTEIQDMLYARFLMEKYASEEEKNSLELFELVVDKYEKKMGFALARWVVDLATHFHGQYGADQGDFIVRQIISRYIIQGHSIH